MEPHGDGGVARRRQAHLCRRRAAGEERRRGPGTEVGVARGRRAVGAGEEERGGEERGGDERGVTERGREKSVPFPSPHGAPPFPPPAGGVRITAVRPAGTSQRRAKADSSSGPTVATRAMSASSQPGSPVSAVW